MQSIKRPDAMDLISDVLSQFNSLLQDIRYMYQHFSSDEFNHIPEMPELLEIYNLIPQNAKDSYDLSAGINSLNAKGLTELLDKCIDLTHWCDLTVDDLPEIGNYQIADADGEKPLTDDEWNTISRVRAELLKNLDDMIKELQDYTSGKSNNISPAISEGAKKWLRIDIDNSRSAGVLVHNLTQSRLQLAAKDRDDFRMMPPDGTTNAMVYPLGQHIHIYPMYFNLAEGVRGGGSNQFTKQGTMFHEMTHFVSVLGTNFFPWEMPEEYRHKEAGEAPTTRNAQNWRFFYEGYAFR